MRSLPSLMVVMLLPTMCDRKLVALLHHALCTSHRCLLKLPQH